MVLMISSMSVLGVLFLYNDNLGLKAVVLILQGQRVSLYYLWFMPEQRCLVMAWCKHLGCQIRDVDQFYCLTLLPIIWPIEIV